MKVKVYSHGFFVYPTNNVELKAVYDFSSKLAHVEMGKDSRTGELTENVKAVYCGKQSNNTEWVFLIACLPLFKRMAEEKWRIKLDVIEVPLQEPAEMSAVMKSHFSPRGEQPSALAYAIDRKFRSRTLEAATGFGKTILGYFVMAERSVRTVAVMEPGHIETWVKCSDDYMGLKPGKDVLVVKGSSALKSIMQMGLDDQLTAKFILISGTTMRNYIKEYETQSENGFSYPVKPQDLWPTLKAGFMLRDEVHEAIHSTVRQVMYSHIPCIMYLSATLVSDDEFINGIYNLIYGKPAERWKSKNNNHICMRPVMHYMDHDLLHDKKFRYKGPRGYSHVLYEQSIMKRKSLLEPYMDYIDTLLRSTLGRQYADGKNELKGLILCSTMDMCRHLQAYLQIKYPDKTIGCFVDGAPKEELYERDIIISTSKGAGTGKDIPNLFVVIQTIALGSVQLGLQIMGRLRPVKAYPELDPMYLYLNNRQLRPHMKYHEKRLTDTKGKIKDCKVVETGFKLGSRLAEMMRQRKGSYRR